LFDAKSAADIAENPPPSIEWDVDTLIERDSGPALWFGDSDSYKSWLALHLAACIAKGEPVFGHYKTKPRINVFYINLDAGRAAFERRVCRLENPPSNLYVINKEQWNADKFDCVMRENKDNFYIIDCWGDIYDPDMSAEQARDMREAVREIRAYFEKFKANGIIIDHSKRKQTGSSPKPADQLYGSAQKKATFRQVTHIEPVAQPFEPGHARVKITCVKMSEAEKFNPFYVDVVFDEGKYSCTYGGPVNAESDRETKAEEGATKLAAYLQSVYPEAVGPTDLAHAIGTTRTSGTFKRAMTEAAESIEPVGKARALRYRFRERANQPEILF
jgi:hypothetical protein